MKRKRKIRAVMQDKKSEPVQLKAAGGVVIQKKPADNHILLIYRNGAWDLPKGKLEEGESIPGCAIREVMEETGLSSEPLIHSNLGTTEHTYIQDDVHIEKETYWFVMTLPEEPEVFKPQQGEGISKVEWVSAKKAEERVGYQNLKDLIDRFNAYSN